MKELNAIFVLLILGFFACDKVETPPPSTGDPVFSIATELDGNNLNITAGAADYYLFTSHEIDELNVRSFVATFAKIDCLDECQDTFRIIIRDAQQNGININEALSIGSYNYVDTQPSETIISDTTFLFSFTVDASNSITSGVGNITYDWQIGNYDTTTFTPSFDYAFKGNLMDKIPFSLTISDAICSSSKTIQIQLDTINSEVTCIIDIEISPAGTDFLVSTIGVPPFTYTWMNGVTTEIIDLISGIETYGVTMVDATGCESSASITLDTISVGLVNCRADFNYTSDVEMIIDNTVITTSADSLQLSRVIIEYVDENGNFYTTKAESQPSNSNFSTLSVEDFMNNENDQKTKQLEVDFDCVLFNKNGLPPLNLTNGSGKIAVAYPD